MPPLIVSGAITAVGSQLNIGTINATSTISTTGTVTGYTVNASAGGISAAGNITAGAGHYFVGNGYYLTGLTPFKIFNGNSYANIDTANANLGQQTTAYTTSGEVVGTGYTAGGQTLVISTPPTQNNQYNVTYVSFNNVTWNPASFTARGALVYNANTGAACFVLNFGSDKICTTSFTIQFPAATYSSAILTLGTTTSSVNYSSPS